MLEVFNNYTIPSSYNMHFFILFFDLIVIQLSKYYALPYLYIYWGVELIFPHMILHLNGHWISNSLQVSIGSSCHVSQTKMTNPSPPPVTLLVPILSKSVFLRRAVGVSPLRHHVNYQNFISILFLKIPYPLPERIKYN